MNNIFKITLGLVVSGVCLFFAFRGFNWSDLWFSISTANWIWLLPSFGLILFSYFLRTFRWKILLSPIKEIKFSTVFIILTFGFMVNNILPLRLGELARVYGLKKLEGVRFSSGLGAVALERISDTLGILFVIFVSLSLLPRGQVPIQFFVVIFLVAIAAVIGFFIFFKKRGEDLIKIKGVVGKIFLFIKNITIGFAAIESPKKIILTVASTIAVWSIDCLTLAVVSRVFDLNLSFQQAAAVIIGIAVGVMIPASHGYVGTYELFAKNSMVLLGFPQGPALSFIILIHFFQLVATYIFGLPGLFKIGLSGIKLKNIEESNSFPSKP